MDQDKTQILPKVSSKQVVIAPKEPKPPVAIKKGSKKKKAKSWGWLKLSLVLIVFLLGCFFGMQLMNHWEITSQSNYNDKVHRVNTLAAEENSLNQEAAALTAKQSTVQAAIQELEGKKQELTKEKNIFQALFDEITGKNEEEAQEVDKLDKEIAKAKSTLKEIDAGLSKIQKVKDKTTKLKKEAQEDLLRYESQWEGFVYKFKLFIGNLTK